MISLRSILMIGPLCFISACDGHGRLLYLHAPDGPRRSWYDIGTTIEIESEANVEEAVAQVAQELGMTRDAEAINSYRCAAEGGFTFMMDLLRREDGLWVLRLLDWPTTKRSSASRLAEEGVRSRLEGAHIEAAETRSF